MAALKKFLSYFWPQNIVSVKGNVSPVLEVTFENGRKVLNAGHVNYSFGSLHEVFRLAFEKIKLQQDPPANVLILGFGAGSIAQLLRYDFQLNSTIIGVEADAAVIRLAREHFGASALPDITLIEARAEQFVQTASGLFDLIAVDVFVEDQVPAVCKTEEFLNDLKRLLDQNGKVMFNLMPGTFAQEEDAFTSRFRRVFPVNEIVELRLGDVPNRVYVGYNIS